MNIRTIVNTRPVSQSQQTCEAFEKMGFNVIDFPCIEIVQSDDIQNCKKSLKAIHAKSVVIFTSQQAVIFAFKLLSNWKLSSKTIVIAVGNKTAQCLEQFTGVNIFVPEQQNSQGVIDLLDGLKSIHSISLITAKNGRNEIQDYAKENNIKLSQINVYQRKLPSNNLELDGLNGCLNNKLAIGVLATSATTLDNFKLLVNHAEWLMFQRQLIICASSRIENHVQSLGCKNTINTESANPRVMATKLCRYLSSH